MYRLSVEVLSALNIMWIKRYTNVYYYYYYYYKLLTWIEDSVSIISFLNLFYPLKRL